MATVVYTTDGFTAMLSADEQATLATCRARFGDSVVGDLVTNWIEGYKYKLFEGDARALFASKDVAVTAALDTLVANTKAAAELIVVSEPVGVIVGTPVK